MVEAELLIGQLRAQVRDLQSLLNYLENRLRVDEQDYAYSRAELQELISGLQELERFASQRGAIRGLRAEWLN